MSTTISNSISQLNTNTTSGAASGSGASGSGIANYATGNGTGTLSSLGIGSGINASALISSLIAAGQAPINAINNQIAGYQSEISSFGVLSASVYSFQTALGGLTTASSFQGMTATPTNAAVLSATATSKAQAGNYALNVTQLAQAQSLVAAGQTSQTSAIGAGTPTTISFQFGNVTGGTTTNGKYSGASFTQSASRAGGSVTINGSNNTLQGIVQAINASNVGVNASIVNDGSGTPYRLELTSAQTGAASSMKITVSGDSSLQSLLGQDPAGTQNLTQMQAGQDASLTVNGLAVSSPSNTVSQAINGATLSLTSTGTSNLTVAQDSKTTASNVQAFVTAYNTLDSSINQLTAAGTSTTTAGPLAGQFSVLMAQNQLREALGNTMVDSSGKQATLADIGITFQKDGTLALDSNKLNSVMASNPGEVASLFAQNGTTTDSNVQFVSANAAAAAGTYQVNVAKLATQGATTGSVAAGTTITAGVNDGLTAVVDGTAANVIIPPGSYTPDSLASAVQSAINGSPLLSKAGKSVTVAQNGGVLTLSSASYGSNSFVSLGGTAANGLVGASPQFAQGTDVAGTINGMPATGNGQTLTAALGGAAAGVAVNITGGNIGTRGTVSISQGFANVLNNLSTQFNSPNGLITTSTTALNNNVSNDTAQISRLSQQLTLLQQQYTTEFTNLDTVLSGLNATQSYLTGQLNSLASTTAYIYSSSSSG